MTTLLKSEYLDDWFVIEPWRSGQPEGTKREWLEILDAMKERQSESFKRVGIHFTDKHVHFTSPRNSHVESEASIHESEIDQWIVNAKNILNN